MVAAPGMRSLVGETWPAHRRQFRFKKHSESRKLRKAVACASRYFSHLSFNYYFFPSIFISSLLGIRRKASYGLANQSIKFRCVLKLTQKVLNILGNYCLESDQQFSVIQHPAGMDPFLFSSSHESSKFHPSGVSSLRLRPRHCLAA